MRLIEMVSISLTDESDLFAVLYFSNLRINCIDLMFKKGRFMLKYYRQLR